MMVEKGNKFHNHSLKIASNKLQQQSTAKGGNDD